MQGIVIDCTQEPGVASLLPLDGSVVQRLQRFGTYSHLKQLVRAAELGTPYCWCCRLPADDTSANHIGPGSRSLADVVLTFGVLSLVCAGTAHHHE